MFAWGYGFMPLKKTVWIVVLAWGAYACHPNNETKVAPDLKQGEKTYIAYCASCHSKMGEGVIQLKAPALAGLEAAYVYRQMMNFKNGVRGYVAQDTSGQQMAAIAKSISDTVMLYHVATYIDSLPSVPYPLQVAADAQNGKEIYQSICGSCHGATGQGNTKLNAPSLLGAQPWYIASQFQKFKNGWRGSHPSDKFGAQMAAITSLVNDQSVNDIIAYLQAQTPSTK
ncbi:MAG: c-type cytochrome [Bacteroidetes bacterium]|nr:c-type cytochrome [Bacteroidota bacterium]